MRARVRLVLGDGNICQAPRDWVLDLRSLRKRFADCIAKSRESEVLELYDSERLEEVGEEWCVGEDEGKSFRVGSSGVILELLTFGGAIRGVWGQPSEIRSAASGGVLSG